MSTRNPLPHWRAKIIMYAKMHVHSRTYWNHKQYISTHNCGRHIHHNRWMQVQGETPKLESIAAHSTLLEFDAYPVPLASLFPPSTPFLDVLLYLPANVCLFESRFTPNICEWNRAKFCMGKLIYFNWFNAGENLLKYSKLNFMGTALSPWLLWCKNTEFEGRVLLSIVLVLVMTDIAMSVFQA